MSSPSCQDQKTVIVLRYHYELYTADAASCDATAIVLPELNGAIPSAVRQELGVPDGGSDDCRTAGGLCNLNAVRSDEDVLTGACTETYAQPSSGAASQCTPVAGYASLEFDPCLTSTDQAQATVRAAIENLMLQGGVGGSCVVKAVYVDRSPSPNLTTSSSKSVVEAGTAAEEGMPPGAVAGIVVAILAAFAVIALLVRRSRRRRDGVGSGDEGGSALAAKRRDIGDISVVGGDGEEGVEIARPEMDEIDRIVASVDAGKRLEEGSDGRHTSSVGGGDANDETFVSEDGRSEDGGLSSQGSDSEQSAGSVASSHRSASRAETEVINGLNLSVSKDALDSGENFELSLA